MKNPIVAFVPLLILFNLLINNQINLQIGILYSGVMILEINVVVAKYLQG